MITNLDDAELSDDILVRLAKRKLIPIDSWQIVKSLFQAHAIDPRLTRHRWIAELLMEFIPEGGYPAVTGRVSGRRDGLADLAGAGDRPGE